MLEFFTSQRVLFIIIKMLQNIKVSVKSQSHQSFPLEINPQMKMTELTQLIMNANILHWSRTQNKALKPISLRSENRQLLIDYLLLSSVTVEKVYKAYQYLKAKQQIQDKYLKEKQFQRNEKQNYLPVVIHYQDEYESYEKVIIQQKYSELSLSRMNQSVLGGQLQFRTFVRLNKQKTKLIEIKSVLKEQLDSFSKFKAILFIKKKLVDSSSAYPQIFGQLQQVTEQQDQINFCFRYVPSLSFSQMMHLQYSIDTIDFLANRTLMLLVHLQEFNLQGYLYKLYKAKSLKILLDKLRYCLDNRVIIDDLSLLLQQGSNQRFSVEQRQDLLSEIKIYLKLNKSHLDKYQNMVEVQGNHFYFPVSIFSFTKIFLLRNYAFDIEQRYQFDSNIDCFRWKKEPSKFLKKESNINEATTAKKPREVETKSKKKPLPVLSVTKKPVSKPKRNK